MRPHNSLSETTYILQYVFESLVMMLMYRTSLFRCMGSFSYKESVIILWTAVIIIGITTVLVTIRKWRNNISITLGSSIPYGIYTIVSYLGTLPLLMGIALFLAIMLSVIYCILILHVFSGKKTKKKVSFAVNGIKTIFGCTVFIMMGFLYLNTVLKSWWLLTPSVKSQKFASQDIENIGMILSNSETLSCFNEEKWYGLSLDEKLDCCQTILNVESNKLGIPIELNCSSYGGMPENVVAYYDDRTHFVVLSIDHIEKDNPEDILDTLLHEARHAWQICVCKEYEGLPKEYKQSNLFSEVFSDIRHWQLEFNSYTNGVDEQYSDYYTQSCEVDARNYAKERVDYYMAIL